jgi:hypothetical protein
VTHDDCGGLDRLALAIDQAYMMNRDDQS